MYIYYKVFSIKIVVVNCILVDICYPVPVENIIANLTITNMDLAYLIAKLLVIDMEWNCSLYRSLIMG